MALLSYALNSILGSALIFILIFADYVSKYNTDFFQRTIFLNVLFFSFIALLADGFYFALNGYPGRRIYYFLYADLTVYYVFQTAAFYYVFILIDYLAFKNRERSKVITHIIWAFFIVHGIILLLNLPLGFYFYISENNVFFHGNFFIIRLIVSYFPLVLLTADLVYSSKILKNAQIYLAVLFVLFTGTGSVMDLVFNTGSLFWPCYSSSLLYVYFFILKTDSKIDSLTGIGNRYSFNEFIDTLARQNVKQAYAVVMIDIDHFKQINDTLGHLEGDNALRDLAAIIKGCIRHSDFAARYGGDEFVLATKAENNIEKLMERLQQAIAVQNEKNTRPYKIEISYGYDIFTTHSNQSIEKFLARIDSLMYQNKTERERRRKEDKMKESGRV
jgi:diguanylate cyclase (GGDEF)-like protein